MIQPHFLLREVEFNNLSSIIIYAFYTLCDTFLYAIVIAKLGLSELKQSILQERLLFR